MCVIATLGSMHHLQGSFKLFSSKVASCIDPSQQDFCTIKTDNTGPPLCFISSLVNSWTSDQLQDSVD